MPKTSLQSLIRKTVSALQKNAQPYNLATVLKNLNAPTDFVIDVDKAETLLVKDFYINQGEYEIDIIDTDVVFAPVLMSRDDVKNILYPFECCSYEASYLLQLLQAYYEWSHSCPSACYAPIG